MANAERSLTARPFGISLVLLFFLLCPLTVVGQSEQKQDGAEDTFVARHREAMRNNPEGVSFTLRLEEDKLQFKPGEVIRVEFSFISNLPGAYDLDGSTSNRGG